jgi:predicted RNA polymerase sigma factor
LAEEAIYMGRLLLRFMPAEPEVQGLLALMLHCEARRDARRNATGHYVPLSEQDISLWSRTMIKEAERCLSDAAQASRIGRFQLEAAIQSVHAQRAWTGRTEWEEIALLYEGLVRLAPTIGVLVGRAAAVAEARGVDRGLELLEAIPTDAIKSYQPYWALTAHLFKRMQRYEEARTAYSRAIGLCTDPSIREFLNQQACQI